MPKLSQVATVLALAATWANAQSLLQESSFLKSSSFEVYQPSSLSMTYQEREAFEKNLNEIKFKCIYMADFNFYSLLPLAE